MESETSAVTNQSVESTSTAASNGCGAKRPSSPSGHGGVERSNEEKQKKIEEQTIYYPHQEQPELSTFDEEAEEIDLSLSRVKRIDDFSRFKRLRSLCFRSNLLKTLADENLAVGKGLHALQELDFYDNQIERIENLGQFGATLRTLDLSFNRLKRIENLNEFVHLTKLFLVHNNINKIENLTHLTKLELLELGDNQLRSIENLSMLTNLTQLYLGKNKIRKIENLELPNLVILSVQSNRITKIENLAGCPKLEELYISDNGLTKIEGLEPLAHLRVFDCANNQIERIENLAHLSKLEELWFNNNKLSKWEDIDELKQLPALKCLYMEQNPIYYASNVKPDPLAIDTARQEISPAYRRKIIFALPNLEQLDATLISKPSITH